MKQNFKRIAALILALVMALPVLVACSDSGNENPVDQTTPASTDETTTEETTTELTANLPDLDMNGYEFIFCAPSQEAVSYVVLTLDADETTGDLIVDEVYNRNQRIEERFKCKISVVSQPDTQVKYFNTAVQGGDKTFKVFQVADNKVNAVATAGTVADWNTLPFVDLQMPWWNQTANDCLSINGYQFASMGDYDLSEYSKCYMLFVNKELYASIPQTKTVYDMVADGTWTLDNFANTAKQYSRDLNGDGVMTEADDQFGYSACTKVGMQLFATGFDVKWVENDANGKPTFAIPGNELAITKLQKIISTMQNSANWYNIAPKALGGMQDTSFRAGKSVFQAASLV